MGHLDTCSTGRDNTQSMSGGGIGMGHLEACSIGHGNTRSMSGGYRYGSSRGL